MPILYSAIASEKTIISNFALCDGNFREITKEIITKLPSSDDKMTYYHGPYLIHYKLENSLLYICITDKFCQRSRAFLFLNEIQRSYQEDCQAEVKKNFTEVLSTEMYRYSEDYNNIVIRQGELDELNEIGVESSETILGEKLLLVNNPEQISYGTVTYVGKTPEKISISESDDLDTVSIDKCDDKTLEEDAKQAKNSKKSEKKHKPSKRKDSKETDAGKNAITETITDAKPKKSKPKTTKKDKSEETPTSDTLQDTPKKSLNQSNNVEKDKKPKLNGNKPESNTKNTKQEIEQKSPSAKIPETKPAVKDKFTVKSNVQDTKSNAKPKQFIIKESEVTLQTPVMDKPTEKPKLHIISPKINTSSVSTNVTKEAILTNGISKCDKPLNDELNEKQTHKDNDLETIEKSRNNKDIEDETDNINASPEKVISQNGLKEDTTKRQASEQIPNGINNFKRSINTDIINTAVNGSTSDRKWKQYINNIDIEPITKDKSEDSKKHVENKPIVESSEVIQNIDTPVNVTDTVDKQTSEVIEEKLTDTEETDSKPKNTPEQEELGSNQNIPTRINQENTSNLFTNTPETVIEQKNTLPTEELNPNQNIQNNINQEITSNYFNNIHNNDILKTCNGHVVQRVDTPKDEKLKIQRIGMFVGVILLIISSLLIFGPISSLVVIGVASVSYKKYIKNDVLKSD